VHIKKEGNRNKIIIYIAFEEISIINFVTINHNHYNIIVNSSFGSKKQMI